MAIEKGNHVARPLEYVFGKSKNKGTDQVSVTFQFVGGANDGKRITWNGFFTEKTAERTMESLEHCGWDGNSLKAMTGFGSRNVELVIDEEAGQDGNMYPRVQWVNKLFSRGPAHVYGADEMESLDQRLAAINAERKRKRGDGVNEPNPDPFGNG